MIWNVSPEMSDRISAVTPASLDLQDSLTVQIWTDFSLLLFPRLVAYRRPNGNSLPISLDASLGADQDSETRFLEYVDVVVVGVPHGPAGSVLAGLVTGGRVHKAAVAVGPFFKRVESFVLKPIKNCIQRCLVETSKFGINKLDHFTS